MIVLGIESSCDETSLSLLDSTKPEKIIKTLTYSQIELYENWGGVVPEIASRSHLEKIYPLYTELLKETKINEEEIDLIGVTSYPGLLGPLLTGINLAKSISLYRKTPVFPVNHLFAHIEAIHLTEEVSYPYIGCIISGGHSLIVLVKSSFDISIVASTFDDAAGEAFDKGGKLLGLDYPSGKEIDNLSKNGNRDFIKFPRGLSKEKENKNMSFSGVKSALRRYLENNQVDKNSEEFKNICASYQEAIIDTFLNKLRLVNKEYNLPIVFGGGVACNSRLREKANIQYKETFFVHPKYCTDNAAMIANYAFLNHQEAYQYPESLIIDAKSRYIDKKKFRNAKN